MLLQHCLKTAAPNTCHPSACCACPRGGGGPRDIHLENFSVSNGGKELVVDANVSLAVGRRYGLIGRNGTGAGGLQEGSL
jgi:ATP-binding cassette subfamily F protein 3